MDDIDRTSDMVDMCIKYTCQEISSKASAYNSSTIPTSRKCVDCGKEIPKGRLKAVPTATRCVSCQEEFERE